jgi:hypothetical protein
VIRYAIEPLARVRPDIEAILPAQWLETGESNLDLAPNWSLYAQLEQVGGLLVFTARSGAEGAFVGYAAAITHQHVNARTARVSTISTYWVEPGPGRVFRLRGLLRAAMRHLRASGSTSVTVDTHAGLSAGRLLAAMGFREAKISYTLDMRGDEA